MLLLDRPYCFLLRQLSLFDTTCSVSEMLVPLHEILISSTYSRIRSNHDGLFRSLYANDLREVQPTLAGSQSGFHNAVLLGYAIGAGGDPSCESLFFVSYLERPNIYASGHGTVPLEDAFDI